MPELPEVETIRTQLADRLIGRTITDVLVRLPKVFHGNKSDIVGRKIVDVRRRAKIIILDLEGPKKLMVHLKMTGQLVFGASSAKASAAKAETVSFKEGIPFAGFSLPGKHTHVVFKLDKGTLFFNDMRQFGWVKVMDDKEAEEVSEKHGPEPFSDEFTVGYLEGICGKWGRPIKLLLMDQKKIAGIGNIYANEALWCAGISPMKRARELEREQVSTLYKCILEVLEMGIKYQGSSAADEAFVNALGEKGKMQEHFNVYQKQGQTCPRCGKTITMSRIGGRGTFFCPKCQK